MVNNFHEQLTACFNRNDMAGGNSVIMKELGRIAVHHRSDFLDLVDATDAGIADSELVRMYFDNLQKKETVIGTAFLVNLHNKVSGADGDSEVSDSGVKMAYRTMTGYLGIPISAPAKEATEFDWIRKSEGKSGFIADTIAKGVSGITQKAQDANYKRKYGALDLLQAQQKAKADLAASMMAQRTAQIEAARKAKEQKAKNLRTGLIVGGGMVVVMGVLLYLKYRKK